MTNPRGFPDEFRFAAATAAYQIEGAVHEGGRGPSIWDTFSHLPGRIAGGATGDVACDHYHRMPDDVDLMAELGLQAYRCSIAWPRVQPRGTGEFNPAGLDFYRDLFTRLRAAGIAPLVTLYHWDLPQALDDAGGWRNRATSYAFADYAAAMAREFGDLVDTWITVNEPLVITYTGHQDGIHAPGMRDGRIVYDVAHHLNLAHGLAARAIRDQRPDARIAIALNYIDIRPATDSPEDLDAVRRAKLLLNDVFITPIMDGGGYSDELRALTAPVTDWACVLPGDDDLVHQRPDVLGVNYYAPMVVRAELDEGWRERPGVLGRHYGHGHLPGPRNVLNMPIVPDGLTRVLTDLHGRWGLPLLVTENGTCTHEQVGPDGRVHDADRIRYLHDHLAAVADALDAGIPVEGYCVWSLMDNFEWALGYEPRFGLFYVDYPTGERYWKDSARWYADVIRTRALPDEVPEYSPAFLRTGETTDVLSATD